MLAECKTYDAYESGRTQLEEKVVMCAVPCLGSVGHHALENDLFIIIQQICHLRGPMVAERSTSFLGLTKKVLYCIR
jgi:hypothetical protein